MKNPLKIYLCDLTYDTIILVSDTIPINIGFIGSYLKKKLGDKVDIDLFKYPNDLLERVKKDPPDILGLSNYSWNSNLSEYFAGLTKKINPNCIVLQGGTNFPHAQEQQKEFLLNRPNTDVYALFEGERSALNVVERYLENREDLTKYFENPIDGCVFINPKTKNKNPEFVVGKYLERIKDLDEIPSPYLNGMLDKFFDGKLTPFIETNRGCPFTCSFCHTGANYYHKLNKFSQDRVKSEIEFIGKKSKELGITNLHMADVNFGMYPQDKLVCEYLLESKNKYGWPLQIMATTGKNSKKRVTEITSILGNMFSVNMSLQSMSETVLENISRANIRHSDMIAVNNHLRAAGRSTKAELIVPLPGETKKSFIDGLNIVIDSSASDITIYTLMMLHGTEFKTPAYREKHEYKGKFRIVPLNFGEYGGNKIFDFEEVGIATKDLSFEDYLSIRSIALMVESLINGKPFEEFFLYAKQFKIKPADFLYFLYENIKEASSSVQEVFRDFVDETKSELWDTENDLINFYQEENNYQLLKDGKVGGNLIYKYKSKSLTEAKSGWIDHISTQLIKCIQNEFPEINVDKLKSEIEEIKIFTKLKLESLLQHNSNLSSVKHNFSYDVLDWIDNLGTKKLSDCILKNKKSYHFEFTQEQISNRDDNFKRYGTDINALSKIVTRISNLESQFRKIKDSEIEKPRDIYRKSAELFTKYALSN
jgi:radical SAM superfamily enzyme YgiQ (UPF0313 family)